MYGQAVTAFVDMSATRPHRHSLENLTRMLSGDLEHKAEQQQPQEFFLLHLEPAIISLSAEHFRVHVHAIT